MNLADKIAAAGVMAAILENSCDDLVEALISHYGDAGRALATDPDFRHYLDERVRFSRHARMWGALDEDGRFVERGFNKRETRL